MKAPLISVIMPAYNQADYLGDAIRSVLVEQAVPLELIVVNDGSTDGTAAVVASFDDPRLRVIHQANAGLSGARNAGLRRAVAPLIGFLDADDLLLPGALSSYVAYLHSQQEIGMVIGDHIVIDANNRQHPGPTQPGPRQPISICHLLNGNPFVAGTVAVQREWIDKVGVFDESLAACEDWDLWLRLSRAGCQMSFIDRPVTAYRIHPEQMTQDPERMRTASLAVLDKVAADGALPVDLQIALPEAYARAYLRAAARELQTGHIDRAGADIDRAVTLFPTLLQDGGSALVDFFAGWADAPASGDPAEYMRDLFEALPPSAHIVRKSRNQELARQFASSAFRYSQRNDPVPAGVMALRAMRYDLSWASNRGVWAIVGRALAAGSRAK